MSCLGLHRRAQFRPADRVTVVRPCQARCLSVRGGEGLEIIPQPSIEPFSHGRTLFCPTRLCPTVPSARFPSHSNPARNSASGACESGSDLKNSVSPVLRWTPWISVRAIVRAVLPSICATEGSLGGIRAKERLASLARVFAVLRRHGQGQPDREIFWVARQPCVPHRGALFGAAMPAFMSFSMRYLRAKSRKWGREWWRTLVAVAGVSRGRGNTSP